MSYRGKCHALWTDGDHETHLCVKDADHESWHLCICGEIIRDEDTRKAELQMVQAVGCPICGAAAGESCHTKSGARMRRFHLSRARRATRR